MKKVTLENYKLDKYYLKIVNAMAQILKSNKIVTPINIFEKIGLLSKQNIDKWRKGDIKYLEQVLFCNLNKASRIIRIIRFHAHDLNLKPTINVYKRKTNKGKLEILQFSKSGVKKIEEAYSRHFMKLGKEKQDKRG